MLIGTEEGVVGAWTVRRLVESQHWDKDLVLNMKGTPKRPDPNAAGTDIPIRTQVVASGPFAEVDPMRKHRGGDGPRSVYLKKEDFEKYGYAAGCDGLPK